MPQDACCLLQTSINMPFLPPSLSLFEMGFKWQTSFSEYGVICIVGLNRSMHVHSRPVCSCWVLLEALNFCGYEDVLWKLTVKLILCVCMFPVTKAGGWSGGWPIVISFSLRSPSSDSVLLSLFPKNTFISTACLNWEPVSAAHFLLFCLEAVVNVCFL